MLSTLRNAWKVPELRKKFIWTIALVAIFRMGSHIPVPGISTQSLGDVTSSGLLGMFDFFSGGAFSRFSIFALSVSPYINASIITQLLTIAIPSLEQLSKEGDEGRKKIQKITRYLSILFAVMLSYVSYVTISSMGVIGEISTMQIVLLVFTLVVGSTFCMWLGDQITVKGFGNGVSILIFVNIVSQLPQTFAKLFLLKDQGTISIIEIGLFLIGIVALLAAVVYFSLAERRIPIQYAGKAVGSKIMKGQSTNIPLSIIGSAVIAIIFAMSVMAFPETIANLFSSKDWAIWILKSPYSVFNKDSWLYPAFYFVFTIFFTWFYTSITYKPDEMAENLHKSAGFIPGIRPGEATEAYLEKVLTKVSLIGGTFAAIIAVTPIIVANHTVLEGVQFGGTTLLIMVSVSLEFTRQLNSQLVMRHYQGFLK